MATKLVSDGELISSFMGPLWNVWDSVVTAINAGDNEGIGLALKDFDAARRQFFEEKVPPKIRRKAPGRWPYSAEYQMMLLQKYGLPPHVEWTSWTADGIELIGLAAARDEASGGNFKLCAARTDGIPID